jgi:hypothetical protein
MRYLVLSILTGIFSLGPITYPGIFKSTPPIAKANPSPKGSGFVVVELFTSEGCSSCPPADALLEKIQKETKNKEIYLLAFHVDYWNRLGWKDPFSDAEYSSRQNQYASWLKLSTVYTPQVVVNGKTEFIGSDEKSLRNSIRIESEKTPMNLFRLDDLKISPESLQVHYETEKRLTNSSLILVLVQNHAETYVKRGENEGRTLSHIQIVRNLKSISLDGRASGILYLDRVKGVPAQNFELMGFLQNKSNGEILAASRISL